MLTSPLLLDTLSVFFSAVFIVRQIALTFFDFCLNGKIIIASYNRSRNISVFNR